MNSRNRSLGLRGRVGDVDAAMRYAFGREQAGALGRSGKRLSAALEAYQRVRASGEEPGEALLRRVADELWSLAIQREVAGLGVDNIAWLRREFDLPDEIVNRMGALGGPRPSPSR